MSFLFSGIFGKKSEDNHHQQQKEEHKQQPPPVTNEIPSQAKNQKEDIKQSQTIETPKSQDLNTSQSQAAAQPQKLDSSAFDDMFKQPQNKNDAGGGSTDYNPPSIFMGLNTKPTLPTSSGVTSFSSSQGGNSAGGISIFGGLSMNQPPQNQAQPASNPLFAGLNLAQKAQPQNNASADLFNQLNMSNKAPAGGQFGNPYSKASGEFAPPSFMQGPAFQTPQQLMETSMQSSKQYAKDDPFSGLNFNNPLPSSGNTTNNLNQNNINQQNTSTSSGSMFQFLNSNSGGGAQDKKNQGGNSDQKEIGDISMSSINNISKNSFEEVDKNEHLQGGNYYSSKASAANQSNTQQFQSVGGASDTPFYFLKNSSVQQSSIQQNNNHTSSQVNTSIGNFELDKDPKDDNFEEITESKDIIEDRINRIKSVMIDYTMKQQDLSEKISNLQKDIELLQLKLEDTTGQQQRAIENEDYEEADQLNMRITQTKNLIQSKDSQIKRLDEDYMALENKKSDKYRELSTLIHKSLDKMGELKEKQVDEMQSFEESEMNAIEEKQKRLHYESIRIEEIKKEIISSKDKVNQKLLQIEEQVYEDTRPQQLEKQSVESKIALIDQEIADIELLLDRKRRERDLLLSDKSHHEHEIDKSRLKFRDSITKLEKQLEKIGKDLDKNTRENDEQKREMYDLQEYEETYKARIEGFQRELKELEEFERQLRKNGELIDSTMNEKEQCKDESFRIKQEINSVKIKRDNAVANLEYIGEKLCKVDAEVEELQHSINSCEKKISKLEQEKKKAAAAKKFKEASKAQSEIKEFTTQLEESQSKLQDQQREKDFIEKEISKKEEEVALYDAQLKQDQVKFEREQLKLLTYRKEDILDLLQSLKNMQNATNIKKRTESLEHELLKIDNELFELEKKYGEFKFRKGSIYVQQDNVTNSEIQVPINKQSASSNSNDQIVANMPEVESSRMLEEEQKSLMIDDDLQQDNVQAPHSRTKNEVRADIQVLEDKVTELESMLEAAAEAEEYEKADQYQTEIDEIQDQQIAKLREELQIARDEEEGKVQDNEVEEEAYNPPSLGINFDEEKPIEKKDETPQNQQIEIQQKQEEEEETQNQQQPEDEQQIQQIEEQEQKIEEEQNQQQINNEEEEQQEQQQQQQEDEEKVEESAYSPPDLFAGMQLK